MSLTARTLPTEIYEKIIGKAQGALFAAMLLSSSFSRNEHTMLPGAVLIED